MILRLIVTTNLTKFPSNIANIVSYKRTKMDPNIIKIILSELQNDRI